MQHATDLSGHRILLVEDNFFIASDTAAALAKAGADVVGPCSSEGHALALLAGTPPTSVILDLNLGGHCPRFDLARLMQRRGIPMLFLSGYHPDVVPADLARVPWVQKPATPHQVVSAAQRLHSSSARH